MSRRAKRLFRAVLAGSLLSVPAVLIYFASDAPYAASHPGESLVKLTFKHPGRIQEDCRERTPQELARMPVHMRKAKDCERTRPPVYVEFSLDGNLLLARTFPPTGIMKDGPSYAYETFPVPPGSHKVVVNMRDSLRKEGYDHSFERDIPLAPGAVAVIDFDNARQSFVVR
jgi:hypothetical protein